MRGSHSAVATMFLYCTLLYFRLFCKEVDGAWQPFSRDEQDAMFEKIYVLFREIMNVEVSGESRFVHMCGLYLNRFGVGFYNCRKTASIM